MEGELTEVAASADGTIWALYDHSDAFDADLRRWNGSSWQTFEVPQAPVNGPFAQGTSPRAIGMAVREDGQVQIFGQAEYPQRSSKPEIFSHTFDGTRWRSEVFPLTMPRNGVPLIVRGEWIMYGDQVLRRDGAVWRSYRPAAMPEEGSAGDFPVLGGDEDDLWIFGESAATKGGVVALRWNGAAWQQIGLPRLGLPPQGVLFSGSRKETVMEIQLTIDVAVLGANDVWAVGAADMYTVNDEDDSQVIRPVALHWNGRGWTCRWGSAGWDRITDVEPDGAGGAWFLFYEGEPLHLSGGRHEHAAALPDV
ncbi:hypothetical protein B0I32_15029 [Nonomuraea fuscirosea]|uniref:Galactose oxidase-like protein n=1 Tax=Nonomuraea fuscirosea TaxID=1291556 RepID=A0A2T0LNP4_9ACTN|nr:hypothetical protein [Nonomuraea fuscirosea]PRX44816.1 hypothetical protein B0I32_15029 [Nonomuraea fuscirosea]